MVRMNFFKRCANGKYPYSGRQLGDDLEGNVPKIYESDVVTEISKTF